jgi:hypothetical protein
MSAQCPVGITVEVYMFIGYKDFFPEVLESGFFSTKHETLAATVARDRVCEPQMKH